MNGADVRDYPPNQHTFWTGGMASSSDKIPMSSEVRGIVPHVLVWVGDGVPQAVVALGQPD